MRVESAVPAAEGVKTAVDGWLYGRGGTYQTFFATLTSRLRRRQPKPVLFPRTYMRVRVCVVALPRLLVRAYMHLAIAVLLSVIIIFLSLVQPTLPSAPSTPLLYFLTACTFPPSYAHITGDDGCRTNEKIFETNILRIYMYILHTVYIIQRTRIVYA